MKKDITTFYVNCRFLTQQTSGVQRYAFECCLQMKRLGKQIIFLSPKKILQTELAKVLEVKGIGFSNSLLWEQIELPLYLLTKKNYLLFNPCNTAPLLLNKNLLTIHDLAYFYIPENFDKNFIRWYHFITPILCKNARHIFTVSDTIQQQILSNYSNLNNKISITYNGLAENLIAYQDHVRPHKEKIILTVGSLSKRKNIELLVKAFLLAPTLADYKLVVIGAINPIFASISLPSNHRLIIEANADDETLYSFYEKSEIFVSLSSYEGFGIPVLEALSFGCKVLCADIKSYHELFEEYVYFCNEKSLSEVMEKLTYLTEHPSYNKKDIKPLLEKYSYKKSAEQIYKTMLHLVEQ